MDICRWTFLVNQVDLVEIVVSFCEECGNHFVTVAIRNVCF